MVLSSAPSNLIALLEGLLLLPLELADNVVGLNQAAAGPLHANDGVGYPVRMQPVDLTSQEIGFAEQVSLPHQMSTIGIASSLADAYIITLEGYRYLPSHGNSLFP